MDNEKELEFLIKQLEKNYSLYLEHIWKTIQSTLIAIGWLLTSEQIKNVLTEKDSWLKYILTIIIFLLLCLNVLAIVVFAHRSQDLSAKILFKQKARPTNSRLSSERRVTKDLCNLGIINYWKIEKYSLAINIVVIVVLFCFILFLIISKK